MPHQKLKIVSVLSLFIVMAACNSPATKESSATAASLSAPAANETSVATDAAKTAQDAIPAPTGTTSAQSQ